MSDDIKKLELRITELENQLKSLGGGQQQPNIDPEDMKVYQKVSQQLGISGCINECQPVVRCISCYLCSSCFGCYKCINECICGPCSLCIIGGVGGSRFGSLG